MKCICIHDVCARVYAHARVCMWLCNCVCIVLIAVGGTLIILIILPCDKQKEVCDHKFITILWWRHNLFYIYNYG